MRARATVAAILLSVLLAVLGMSPAAAANQVRITAIEQQDGELQVGLSSAAGAIDPASVSMTINGEPVDAIATPINETSLRRVAVLTMDASLSMEGEPIDSARAAAEAFLDGVAADVEVGLVTFNQVAQILVPPTTDREAVRQAVRSFELGPDTALYDAVIQAIATAGSDGSRKAVLLTDGRNDGGTATEEQAVNAAATGGVVVDAVALGDADIQALTAITEAGQGQLVQTQDPAALVGLFSEAAVATSNEVLVSATPPEAFAGSAVTIAVTATVNGQTSTATAAATLAGAPPGPSPTATESPSPTAQPAPEAATPAFLSAAWFPPLAVGLVFLGLLGLLGLALGAFNRGKKDDVTKRLSVYSITSRGATEVERKESAKSVAVAAQALSMADSVVKSQGIEPKLENRLSAADVPMTPAEWLLLHTGAAIGAALLFLLLSSFNPWWAFLGLGLGVLVPFMVLSVRKSRREQRFTDQLPDTLTLMAGSLTAGYSMPQAIDTVVREGQQPIADEMGKALVEARLGVPIEEALENIAIRTQNKDFAWVVMAINIQRQVGGNLSEILRIVAETLRERAYLRRQIRTLSAEGRISAVVIAAMPFVMFLYLILVRPEYITLLFTDTWGIVMLVGALVLQLVGWLWMRRIVNFEV
jgi:tight adherence protein B